MGIVPIVRAGLVALLLALAALWLAGPLAPSRAQEQRISQVGRLQSNGLGLSGEQVTWVITVTNTSDAIAPQVVVTDTVSDHLRVDTVLGGTGARAIDGQRVTIDLGALHPDDSVTIQIITTILNSPVSGVLPNTVAVTGIGDPQAATSTVNIITLLPATGYAPE
jgi:uncharacterized repeat protein (TIGR01451 family)